MRAARAFAPVASGLPGTAWLLQAGVLLNFFGNGLVGPFLVIYLHFVRGIPLAAAGLAIASGGVLATTSGLVAGRLIDRFGARNCLAAAMTANAVAYASYTQVHATWQAFLVGAAVGIGTGAYGPSVQSMLSTLVTAESRAAAFSQQRLSAIVGLGLGALAGGLIAGGGSPFDYQLLLLLDAGTFAGFAVLLLRLPNHETRRESSAGGYREAWRDGRLRMLALVNLILVTAGLAPTLVLLPAFAKGQAHVPAAAIGIIFAVNTTIIVGAQLHITRAIARREPMRTLALGAGLWALFWSVVLVSGSLLSSWVAGAVIALGMAIYAAGECVYTAILTPTVVAIAPDALRGRYLGVLGFSWQAGFMIGPAAGAFLLDRLPLSMPLAAGAGCLLAAWLLISSQGRERSLPGASDRRPG